MIIILISFVISYFLFSLGASFYHLIYVIYEDVLKVDQNGFFNTCLNTQGNLINLFKPSQVTCFTEFDDFYHLIIRQNKIIKKLDKPEIINQYLKEIKEEPKPEENKVEEVKEEPKPEEVKEEPKQEKKIRRIERK